MLNGKTFLAIIPARGGSKRLPKKNVLDLAGKPMISWTIEAAKQSKYIDKVLVSSEDEEILEIAKKNGATVIGRPSYLASDTATTFDAVKNAIDNTEYYDYIVLLQATSPLRNSQHIDEAIELLEYKNADAVISVCEMEHSPSWSNVLPDDGDMSQFIRNDAKNTRSQDLDVYYRLNGAIYLCQVEKLCSEKSFFLNNNIFAYKMDGEGSIDIDTAFDFNIANCLILKK